MTSRPPTSSGCWYVYSETADQSRKVHDYGYTLSLSVIVDRRLMHGFGEKRLLIVVPTDSPCQAIEECTIRNIGTYSKQERALVQMARQPGSVPQSLTSTDSKETRRLQSSSFDIVLEVIAHDPGYSLRLMSLRELGLPRRDRYRILIEKTIPSGGEDQFYLKLTDSLNVPFIRSPQYGPSMWIERCAFHILPAESTYQSPNTNTYIIRLTTTSILCLIGAWVWPYFSPGEDCKSLLNSALVCKAWVPLVEVYYKKIGAGYPIINPEGLLRSLSFQPTMTRWLRNCVLNADRQKEKGKAANALSSLLKLQLPLLSLELDPHVFIRAQDFLPALSSMRKFRLSYSQAGWDLSEERLLNISSALESVFSHWPQLDRLELGQLPNQRADEINKSFPIPLHLSTLSLDSFNYKMVKTHILENPNPSISTLRLDTMYGLNSHDLFLLLKHLSTSLEELTIIHHPFFVHDPRKSSVDKALPSLKRLRYLEVMHGASAPCTSTATIALKPHSEDRIGRSKLVIYVSVWEDGLTMSEALEMTNWSHIEFRGTGNRIWQTPKEEWLEIANRRGIKFTFDYNYRWIEPSTGLP